MSPIPSLSSNPRDLMRAAVYQRVQDLLALLARHGEYVLEVTPTQKPHIRDNLMGTVVASPVFTRHSLTFGYYTGAKNRSDGLSLTTTLPLQTIAERLLHEREEHLRRSALGKLTSDRRAKLRAKLENIRDYFKQGLVPFAFPDVTFSYQLSTGHGGGTTMSVAASLTHKCGVEVKFTVSMLFAEHTDDVLHTSAATNHGLRVSRHLHDYLNDTAAKLTTFADSIK